MEQIAVCGKYCKAFGYVVAFLIFNEKFTSVAAVLCGRDCLDRGGHGWFSMIDVRLGGSAW